MSCPNGFEEIGINSGWCVEITTDATIFGILALGLATIVVTYLLSTKNINWKKIWKKLR